MTRASRRARSACRRSVLPGGVYRHRRTLTYETDGRFWVGVGLTRSERYLHIAVGSKITSESWLLDAADPTGAWSVVLPRRQGVEYSVEHQLGADGDRLLILHNDGAENFELVTAPLAEPSRWEPLIPHSADTRLLGAAAFADFTAVYYRRNGLTGLRILRADGSSHEVAFDDVVYTVSPGGNPEYETSTFRLAYVSLVTPELTAKRLELLRLSAPKARRFILLTNSANSVMVPQLEAAQERARTLGVQLIPFDARNASELDAALARIPQSGAGGVVVSADLLFLGNRAKIARTLRETRLPAIFPATEYHDAGVLMSYGPSLKQAMRRVAVYVDKILRGAKPADLPVQQPTKFELVINLKTAKTLGLEVPATLLARADEVIE